ncbi:MAG: biopolymer transporter ExbD [Roseibium sp.]|uniref:ExbD/TolR family protein n=1 Tax=Roseibium sp. TaxID=1936156 RepID=UPI003D9C1AFA
MILIHPPIGKRRRIPLTPLIDVIFILVMFFLLSSTFGIWRPLDVALGGGDTTGVADAVPVKGAPAVLINLRAGAGGTQPQLVVNGINVPLNTLAAELNRLAEAGAQTAVLIPDAAIDFQQVVRVLDEAKTSRLKRVSLKLD